MGLKGMPRVKICCISSREEAELTMAYGAAALRLVAGGDAFGA